MLFNSSQFICFFIVACLLYYLLPLQAKKGYLLLVSYVFYTFWDPRFLVFLGGITVLTYFGARIIEKNRKKGQLYLLIILTFLPLFFFKYYGFTITRMEKLLHAIGISADIRKPDLLLPIGISFFTFQAVGYLVDVWRGTVSAEKNILNYALFLSFFPQQASGPIGRAGQLLPQIRQPAHLNCLNMQKEASAEVSSVYDQVLTGVTYMLYGYFQKVVVADSLGAIVDSIYGAFRTHNSVTLLLASFLYSMQIYCDFAGYSNLALGAGKVLGFDLIQNFEAPYLASSVAEFWRRWHISLTTWFRDYLYIPLGGNRKGKIRQYFNILVVFLASGIWHGVGLHYMVWGALNGIYQIIGRSLKPVRDKICQVMEIDRMSFSHQLLKRVVTFLLVNFSWVFFRINGTKESLYFFQSLLLNRNMNVQEVEAGYLPGVSPQLKTVLFLCILVVVLVDLAIYNKKNLVQKLMAQGSWLKITVFLVLIFTVLIFGHYGGEYDASQFIYLQY